MQELTGRVAVVTGAASGIGRGLAERFAAEGMKVVLADVEERALSTAEAQLSATGAEVWRSSPTCRPAPRSTPSPPGLAEWVWRRPRAVQQRRRVRRHGTSGRPPTADWQWVLGVNLMGVVHGIQAFVPGMVAHGEPGHVVNTSSVLGLSSGSGSIYSVSKHAVTRLSEGLYHDLRAAEAPVGVSVLCPGMIATRIVTADRNRPAHLRNPGVEVPPEMVERRKVMQERFLETGMPPAEVAGMVVDAIRSDRFYVLTHPDMIRPQVEGRL